MILALAALHCACWGQNHHTISIWGVLLTIQNIISLHKAFMQVGLATRVACVRAYIDTMNTSFMDGLVVRAEKRGASMGTPEMWGYSKPPCSFYALFHSTCSAVRHFEGLGHFFLVSYHNSQVLVPFPKCWWPWQNGQGWSRLCSDGEGASGFRSLPNLVSAWWPGFPCGGRRGPAELINTWWL